jgi:hypothetical protein
VPSDGRKPISSSSITQLSRHVSIYLSAKCRIPRQVAEWYIVINVEWHRRASSRDGSVSVPEYTMTVSTTGAWWVLTCGVPRLHVGMITSCGCHILPQDTHFIIGYFADQAIHYTQSKSESSGNYYQMFLSDERRSPTFTTSSPESCLCSMYETAEPWISLTDASILTAGIRMEWQLCKIWGFHGGNHEEWCLLGCYAVWLL